MVASGNTRKRTSASARLDDSDTAAAVRLGHRDGASSTFRMRTSSEERFPPMARLRCRLLELPAELRDLIWIHTVTEFQPRVFELAGTSPYKKVPFLQKRPIRLDRLNRPSPPAITAVSRQVRQETLSLYYEHNIFECWRPLFFREDRDWLLSTFGDWLLSLGQERMLWLRNIVLLYKHDKELEHDIVWALEDAGFHLQEGVLTARRELSEYELNFESMGLPRHFGKNKVWDRWTAGSSV